MVHEDTNYGNITKQWQQNTKQNLQPPRLVPRETKHKPNLI